MFLSFLYVLYVHQCYAVPIIRNISKSSFDNDIEILAKFLIDHFTVATMVQTIDSVLYMPNCFLSSDDSFQIILLCKSKQCLCCHLECCGMYCSAALNAVGIPRAAVLVNDSNKLQLALMYILYVQGAEIVSEKSFLFSCIFKRCFRKFYYAIQGWRKVYKSREQGCTRGIQRSFEGTSFASLLTW